MRAARVICGVVLGLALALVAMLCPPLGGGAQAGDPELTPAVKKSIDDSLLVFTGEVSEVRVWNTGSRSERQTVVYKVVRVLKGVCLEPRLSVQHVVTDYPDADPKSTSLDSTRFAKYSRLILGVQLQPDDGGLIDVYRLINSSNLLKAVPWTQPVENAIAQYAKSSPVAVQRNESKSGAAQETEARSVCVEHLTDLSQVFLMHAMDNPKKAQKYSGPSLWLQFRKTGEGMLRGQEKVLLCPCDPTANVPSESNLDAWDKVDLEHPAAGLCSYVGRDFATAPISMTVIVENKKEVIGACLHHPGGVVIAYATGEPAEFLTLKQLGLASEAEKVVGPASKSPLLRVLR